MSASVSAHLKDEVAAERLILHIFKGVVLLLRLCRGVVLMLGLLGSALLAMVGDAVVSITEWKDVGLQYSQRVLASVV